MADTILSVLLFFSGKGNSGIPSPVALPYWVFLFFLFPWQTKPLSASRKELLPVQHAAGAPHLYSCFINLHERGKFEGVPSILASENREQEAVRYGQYNTPCNDHYLLHVCILSSWGFQARAIVAKDRTASTKSQQVTSVTGVQLDAYI